MKIKPSQAAEILGGLDPQTIYNYIKGKKLPAISEKRGMYTYYWIELDELREFAERHNMPFNPPPQ